MEITNAKISVVVPVYGCKPCLMELYTRLKTVLNNLVTEFEIIFVNDSSPDDSWKLIQYLCVTDHSVVGINLSRNFGQHNAITAGIDYVSGDYLVVMDCDLQDQPEEIGRLFTKLNEGFDVVFGRRTDRQDTFLKKLSSKLFYNVFDYFTENNSDSSVANFSIASRKVVDNFVRIREQNRSYPLFIKWLGFNVGYIGIKHVGRNIGKSSYSFRKLMKLATNSIISQSNKPLRLSIMFGFYIASISLIFGLYLIYKYLFMDQPISGWTSVMVSLYFIGGLLFANMGILGLYIGKIFDEVKQRPLYVVKDVVGGSFSKANRKQDKYGQIEIFESQN